MSVTIIYIRIHIFLLTRRCPHCKEVYKVKVSMRLALAWDKCVSSVSLLNMFQFFVVVFCAVNLVVSMRSYWQSDEYKRYATVLSNCVCVCACVLYAAVYERG